VSRFPRLGIATDCLYLSCGDGTFCGAMTVIVGYAEFGRSKQFLKKRQVAEPVQTIRDADKSVRTRHACIDQASLRRLLCSERWLARACLKLEHAAEL
jgi:hypothetical protein